MLGPAQCSASVLSPRGFSRLGFSLGIRTLIHAVPCNRLHPLHAFSTPVATRSVTRHLAGSSQAEVQAPGLDDTCFLNDASSQGSLSSVSRMLTCASFPRAFPPTHATNGF